MERIDKILALNLNITRGEVKKLLKSGAVFSDGAPVKDGGFKIDPEKAAVFVNGRELKLKKHIYIMLNKPKGVVSATTDALPTVVDILPDNLKRRDLFPAGRLDRDTTGFCLITDDGDFAHRILSPAHHITKRYRATVSGDIDLEAAKEAFLKGVVLSDGTALLSAELEFLYTDEAGRGVYEVFVDEGKYHQVKRMFSSVGGKVEELKRLSMGGLSLDETLLPGEAREMCEEEIRLVEFG